MHKRLTDEASFAALANPSFKDLFGDVWDWEPYCLLHPKEKFGDMKMTDGLHLLPYIGYIGLMPHVKHRQISVWESGVRIDDEGHKVKWSQSTPVACIPEHILEPLVRVLKGKV